jgi:hypothetical protein
MLDVKQTATTTKEVNRPLQDKKTTNTNKPPVWETPKLEDVSEQVMAQPYIRFT